MCYLIAQMVKDTQLLTFILALILVRTNNSINVVRICNVAQQGLLRQSGRFLECTDDNFLLQMIKEPMRRGALLGLILTNKKGLVRNVKIKGSLGCSDHVMV